MTISLVPSLSGGPWIYWDEPEISIPKASAAGFDAVELFTASADEVDAGKLGRLLDDNNIKLAAVGTGAGKALHGLDLISADKEIRRKARDFIRAMMDFGAQFDAPAIIGSMQGQLEEGVSREQGRARLVEGLRELCEKAAGGGVSLLFEPLNRYETEMINTVGDGVNLIKSLNSDNVRLLADLFHMNIEEESIADSIRAGGQYIGHVHFVDSNRRPAGMGHMDLSEAARALKDIGFDGYASAEALAYPDPDSAAAQTMSAFRQFLA